MVVQALWCVALLMTEATACGTTTALAEWALAQQDNEAPELWNAAACRRFPYRRLAASQLDDNTSSPATKPTDTRTSLAAQGRLRLNDAGSFLPDPAAEEAQHRRWYLFLAAVNAYPKLESERPIRNLFDPLMRALAPTHDAVRTVGDLRDDHLLWPPHVGFGYDISDHWGLQFQVGYTAGKVRTVQDARSILLLPLHTDFEIYRSAAFVGAGLDYFPWGAPRRRDYENIRERLRAARPALGIRGTLTYATYNAKVRVGLGPIPNLGLEFSDAWLVRSVNLNAGVDIPWSRHSLLSFNGGYNVFFDRAFDFEGAALTIAWKHYVR